MENELHHAKQQQETAEQVIHETQEESNQQEVVTIASEAENPVSEEPIEYPRFEIPTFVADQDVTEDKPARSEAETEANAPEPAISEHSLVIHIKENAAEEATPSLEIQKDIEVEAEYIESAQINTREREATEEFEEDARTVAESVPQEFTVHEAVNDQEEEPKLFDLVSEPAHAEQISPPSEELELAKSFEEIVVHIEELSAPEVEKAGVLLVEIIELAEELKLSIEEDEGELVLKVQAFFEHIKLEYNEEQVMQFIRAIIEHKDIEEILNELKAQTQTEEGTHESKVRYTHLLTAIAKKLKEIPLHLNLGRFVLRSNLVAELS